MIENQDVNVEVDYVKCLFEGDSRRLRAWLSEPANARLLGSIIVDEKTDLMVAVMFAIRSPSHAERNKRMQCIRILIDEYTKHHVNVNTANSDGSSALGLILSALASPDISQDKVTFNQLETIRECLLSPKPISGGLTNQEGIQGPFANYAWISPDRNSKTDPQP